MSQPNGSNKGGGKEMAMHNIRISYPDWQGVSLYQLDQKSKFVQSLTIHILKTVYPCGIRLLEYTYEEQFPHHHHLRQF
jgi:hypothetical protein